LRDNEQIAKEDRLMAEIDPNSSKAKSNPSFIELGSTGLSRWGGNIYEEFLTNLRWPKAGQIYKEMSHNDPVVTSILLCSRQLIRKVTWRIQPASDSKIDLEAAEFLESCRQDMSMTWSELIDEITSYFEYGWAYHEIIYKRRLGDSKDPTKRSKYTDGRIGWRRISGRSQESWSSWVFDEKDDGNLMGMNQEAVNQTKNAYIPIEKALLFRTTSNRSNPEGRSFLRGAYRPWYFKKHIEEIEGIGIERDLAGLPVLKTPENVDIWATDNAQAVIQRNAAEALVKNIRRDKNEGIVLPFGWDLTLLSSASNRQFDTNQIINRYDQRIATTMLADIVMLGADKVGSFALAEVKKSLLAAALDAQVQGIVSVFNRYAVPKLFSYNVFPGIVELPQITASPVDSPSLKELSEYISKLSGANMPLFPDLDLENYLRSIANLPIAEEDDEARQVSRDNNKNTSEKSSDNKKKEEA
jgi:hypothetical protein